MCLAFPVSLQTSVQPAPHCMPHPSCGSSQNSYYGSKSSGGPLGPQLSNTTAYKDKNQGCLARHHSPNREDSQTLGRFFFCGVPEFKCPRFCWALCKTWRVLWCCDLNTMAAMWLPGGGASRRGLRPLRQIMLFSWDWISYQESMSLDMEGTLAFSLLHTQWIFCFSAPI